VTDRINDNDFVRLSDPNPSRQARHLVRRACGAWPATQVENAQLMVTELVANALIHGRGDVGLQVTAGEHLLVVSVSDQSTALPTLSASFPPIDDEHGRGMHIVDTLAHSWGTRSQPSGKVVWFSLNRDGTATSE
jgi:anti-sigma regulatory factor (Ser/Thr protein kinase)